jgi:hypothetical protein
MSSCGFGFMRTSAPINALVFSILDFAMNPQSPHFSASHTKLRRATKFVQELEAALTAYQDSKPYTVEIDPRTNPPQLKISWNAIDGDPEAIVGDCIHNLRTALDLMSCDLVRSVKGNDKRVYFPFACEEMDTVIKEKNFHRAGAAAVDLLKTFKPYRGGNELLRAIHDLDIEDKHKALILTGTSRNIEIRGAYNVDDPQSGNFSVIAHDINFIFPEASPLAGREVVQTLKDSMELVNGILEAFASLVALRSS